MQQVNVTELRNNLPRYLQQVRKGAEIQVTSHGKSIARLVPDVDDVDAARQRLINLRGTMITGNITAPVVGEEWGGDADNL
jgi:prevent-host-death family protein